MKFSVSNLLVLILLGSIFSCGKNNESGKNNNNWDFNNPYTNGILPLSNINSPFGNGTVSVNQVLQENPCINSFGGIPGQINPYAGQRITIQLPLTQFPTLIQPNDLYVGVTSFGDVGVVVGQAVGQPPLFVGYMCPRSFSPSGQGQLAGVSIGSYSNCLIKPITAARIIFPGGASADFRWLDGGSSKGAPFSFCGR